MLPIDVLQTAFPEDLHARIASLVNGAPADLVGLAAVARQAGDLIERQPLPASLRGAIRGAYARLGQVRTAVRSSGLAEDGELASFAGQFATYLGIVGEHEVIEHVKRCWASQYTARALDYCRRNGLAGAPGMAVGVLEMVPARCSGVAITLDPVTGRRDRVMIEASWGLGEAVVSGHVTPDRWSVDKSSGAILQAAVSGKEVWSAFDEAAGRVVEQPMPGELRARPSLEPDQVAQVAQVATDIERREGSPQDVEWAYREDGELVLLQTRPETTWRQPLSEERFDPVAYAMRNVFGVKGAGA